MPDLTLLSVIAIVVLALVFDYTNGFHDAANSIATVVSTRVLTPKMAVIWAASFNFLAFLIFHTEVANTVGKTVDPAVVSEAVIFAGLTGAIAWNFFTWWLGLPTSSSHALIGGFAGAGVAKAGFGALDLGSLEKTILFIPLSPLFGMALGFLLMLSSLWVFHRSTPARVDSLFRRLADRQDPGPAHHRPQAGRRLLGRDGRRHLPVPGHRPRHPRLHHPHHHWGHRGGGRDP